MLFSCHEKLVAHFHINPLLATLYASFQMRGKKEKARLWTSHFLSSLYRVAIIKQERQTMSSLKEGRGIYVRKGMEEMHIAH